MEDQLFVQPVTFYEESAKTYRSAPAVQNILTRESQECKILTETEETHPVQFSVESIRQAGSHLFQVDVLRHIVEEQQGIGVFNKRVTIVRVSEVVSILCTDKTIHTKILLLCQTLHLKNIDELAALSRTGLYEQLHWTLVSWVSVTKSHKRTIERFCELLRVDDLRLEYCAEIIQGRWTPEAVIVSEEVSVKLSSAPCTTTIHPQTHFSHKARSDQSLLAASGTHRPSTDNRGNVSGYVGDLTLEHFSDATCRAPPNMREAKLEQTFCWGRCCCALGIILSIILGSISLVPVFSVQMNKSLTDDTDPPKNATAFPTRNKSFDIVSEIGTPTAVGSMTQKPTNEKGIRPYVIKHNLDNFKLPPLFAKLEWLEIQGPISIRNIGICLRETKHSLKKLVLNVDEICSIGSAKAARFHSLETGLSNTTFIFRQLNTLVIQNANNCPIFPWNGYIISKSLEKVIITKSNVIGTSYETLCGLITDHGGSIKEVTLEQSSISPAFAAFALEFPMMYVNVDYNSKEIVKI